MVTAMKNRYSLFCNRSRGGIYYLKDADTGQRESLGTKDKTRARELMGAKNEAVREPAFNLQKARVYMAASDPEVMTRTWEDALLAVIARKPEKSGNRDRWETFAKDKALVPILDIVLLETRADQLHKAASVRTVKCGCNSSCWPTIWAIF